MLNEDTMLNAALEYLEMDFSVIPINPATKKPLVKWGKFKKRQPAIEEIERWFTRWPKANIAIITGSISGIYVFDADGPEGIRWVNENLPMTTVYSRTSKGLHVIYKVPEGLTIKSKVRIYPEIDIRGEAAYFIAPPSIHKSGHQYHWQFLLNGWDDLEAFDPYSIIPKNKGNLNLDLSELSERLNVEKIIEGIPEGERDTLLYKEACRLRGKNLTQDEAWNLLKTYATRCRPPFPENEALVKLLQAWKHDPNEAVIEITPHLEKENITEKVIPAHLLNPGGILQEMMAYIESNSTVSVPIFSLGACISCLGNVMGQKVQTETGLRTNIYSISLGYSGTGKNAPFNTLPQIIGRSKAHETIGPTELTSSSAILKWLSNINHRVTFMMLDEIGMVLKGLKRPDSHAADIPRILTKLFSATDRSETKGYTTGDPIALPWHHLSFYGASTPERFWENIGGGEVADGFLARVLVFESRHDSPKPKSSVSFSQNPDLIDKINKIYSIEVKTDSFRGNIEAVPIPIIIPRSTDAGTYFEEWSEKYHNLKNEYKADSVASIYGRAAEHAAKLALIHAVSLDLNKVRVVGIESVKWACLLLDHLIENIVDQIKENVADTDVQRWKQKILKGIREISRNRPYKGATVRDIQRGPCQGLLSADVRKYLDSLVLAEQVGVDEFVTSKNRTVKFFYLA
ncbi:MAG: bifunctional DNA primase/polymerase [Proteobacteria bacterium]|nr:bifunctional DNA primase/polymerase [Pseudomonadota bacterium]